MAMFFKLKYFSICILVLALFAAVSCKKEEKPGQNVDKNPTKNKNLQSQKKEVKRSELKFESDSAVITDYVLLKTSMGKITIGLYGKDAPKTVENFIGLVKKNFYNGILFHRVAKNFIVQAGDPNTKYISKKAEWGKGGKSIWGTEFEDELDKHTPSYQKGYAYGVVAMANRGRNTNTSQFFICLAEAKKLEKKWTIFGRVTEGMDVVEKISQVDIFSGPFEQNDGLPKKPVKLYSVSVVK